MGRRLFVAIDLPREVKHEIAKLAKSLVRTHPQVRLEKTENLHLTLKFLGQTKVEPDLILEKLRQKLTGFPAFSIQFGSLSLILNYSAVMIVEVEQREELLRLYHMVNNCLSNLGFPRERRSFHPHVTIGRIREKDAAKTFQLPPLQLQLPQVGVAGVTLFESKLTENGAIHTTRGTIPLLV